MKPETQLKLKNFKKAQEKLQAKIKSESTDLFKSAFQDLFDEHPALLAVRWQQYTPFFNGGDVCEFGVSDPSVQLDHQSLGSNPDDFEKERNGDIFIEGFYSKGSPSEGEKRGREILDDVRTVHNSFLQEMFEITFGDHVEVTIRRSGEVKVKEYEHD